MESDEGEECGPSLIIITPYLLLDFNHASFTIGC